MARIIQGVRGINDVLPDASGQWQRLEASLRRLATQYGYREIRLPILEQTELFKRSIGEATDVVEKEMYTFADRDRQSISLRPEGTAGCVRAGIEHGILYNQIQRLWYLGPMFRRERPQKGRYRQFQQFGVEAFGMLGPDIDAELIYMNARLWRELGVESELVLQLNSLGSKAARDSYKAQLVTYFSRYYRLLDQDDQRRLERNPLRILDSKNPTMQSLINEAPQLQQHLDRESLDHFDTMQELLHIAGIAFTVNPHLVRGLDYYNKTVFEWVTIEDNAAQNAVCAGGRYDSLVERLGGKATPAVGFAMGLERLLDLLVKVSATAERVKMIYFIMGSGEAKKRGLVLAEQLRTALPSLTVCVDCGTGGFRSQFRRADKSGAQLALILGDDELESETIVVKPLREPQAQIQIAQSELVDKLQRLI